MKNLYYLETAGHGDYYVLAEHPTEAQEALEKIFNNQDYGFPKNRKVTGIILVCESFQPDYRDKKIPLLSPKETKLLVVKDWDL